MMKNTESEDGEETNTTEEIHNLYIQQMKTSLQSSYKKNIKM